MRVCVSEQQTGASVVEQQHRGGRVCDPTGANCAARRPNTLVFEHGQYVQRLALEPLRRIRRMAKVSMPPLRSPSMSTRSLVTAITAAYTVINRARKATAGVQTNGSPSACEEGEHTKTQETSQQERQERGQRARASRVA